MRSEVGRAVRRRFKECMRRRLPGFGEVRGAIVPPGWPVYGLRAGADFDAYVVLAVHRREDSFTVEGAWTRNGSFPHEFGLASPRAWPGHGVRAHPPRDGNFRFRIAQLWQPGDHWWRLVPEKSWDERCRENDVVLETGVVAPDPPPDEALGKVDAAVTDAVGKIERYLLPYFDEVAAAAGCARSVSALAAEPR